MFDIGFTELLLLAVVALLVLGPERLPEAARTAGLLLGKLRSGFESIRSEVQRELQAEELRQKLEAERQRLGLDDIRKSIEDTVNDAGSAGRPDGAPTDTSADTPTDSATRTSAGKPLTKDQVPPP